MSYEFKMTEDEVIGHFIAYLERNNWTVKSCCIEGQRGTDIIAQTGNQLLLIEAKGARARDNAPTKKRKWFDCGQVKNHLGMAIVKSLELKRKNPGAVIAIVHPYDSDIVKWIGDFIEPITHMGIKHYWVYSDGTVQENK